MMKKTATYTKDNPGTLGGATRGAAIGLYVHIPFCISKCAYCDFVSYAGRASMYDDYVAAAEVEIARAAPRNASTVYFGGGTPTVLGHARLARLLDALRKRFPLERGAEITCEANPGTISPRELEALRAAGFNRLSIGVQSFDDAVLRVLGRSHDVRTAGDAVLRARSVFDNVSVDLMYGSPGQTLSSWEFTLSQAIDLGPQHISAYCLTLELGTSLASRIGAGEIAQPDEDLAADMMAVTSARLRSAGYEHYEISNFAKPGSRCAHNVDCWGYRDYVGFGAAAHSKAAGLRWANHAGLNRYIGSLPAGGRRGAGPIRDDSAAPQRLWVHKLSSADRASEATILGLRLIDGMSNGRLRRLWERAGTDVSPLLARLAAHGLIRVGRRVRLSECAVSLANEVFREFA